jgi:hypothetical protein
MTHDGIPTWNAIGIIPPNDVMQPTVGERSPYQASLKDFVLRFGRTDARRTLLTGLLRYREGLHSVGLTEGFQWLDGSFLEDIEAREARAPNDIDVVTFYHLPNGKSQSDVAEQDPALFRGGRALKSAYHVDAYLVDLGGSAEYIVERSRYWYSMWSHRRDGVWKGYLQINLDPAEDTAARVAIDRLVLPRARP